MGVDVKKAKQQFAIRSKVAGMLVITVGLTGWSCGSDDPRTGEDDTAGGGAAADGTGGVTTGGGSVNTGGSAPHVSGVGGSSSGGLGGAAAVSADGSGGRSTNASGGGTTGGTGSQSVGGVGGAVIGVGGTTGGASGSTGGASGSTGGASGTTGGRDGMSGGMSGSTGGATGTGNGSAGTAGIAGGTGDSAGGTTGDGTGGATGGAEGGAGGSGGATGGVGGETGGSTGTSSPGCGTPISRPPGNVQQTMDVDGTTRYYLLHVPAQADNQTPLMLVFGLHGYDMNNVAVAGLYDFTERSNGQAITVLPYGEGPPPGDVSHWGDHVLESTWQANAANYKYIQQLMEDLQNRFCIDTRRVFIAGFSMGGFFTNTIACDHSDWFRGFAPIAGGGPGACADGVRSAIMIHHGTVDDIVDISSGKESRDFWVQQNECAQTTTSAYEGCESYEGCSEGTPVHWCVGNFNHTITSTTAANIWTFFSGLE